MNKFFVEDNLGIPALGSINWCLSWWCSAAAKTISGVDTGFLYLNTAAIVFLLIQIKYLKFYVYRFCSILLPATKVYLFFYLKHHLNFQQIFVNLLGIRVYSYNII